MHGKIDRKQIREYSKLVRGGNDPNQIGSEYWSKVNGDSRESRELGEMLK